MIRFLPVAALVAALAGCAAGGDPRARLPITGFTALPADARVWVEPGYEAFGHRVAAALPAAIHDVETAHYLPFLLPPRVYVCGTPDCFRRWVKTRGAIAAVVPDHRLVLSPKLDAGEAWRLPGLLRHELAHLHLGQRYGQYHNSVPVWFHEGWASLTAHGGGAEFVSDADVAADIRAGRRIRLDLRDLPEVRHRAPDSGLEVHAFYRQAMLAVDWLKRQDETRFRTFVLALQDGADFEIAFWDVYGTAPKIELEGFFDAMLARADTATPPPATEPSSPANGH